MVWIAIFLDVSYMQYYAHIYCDKVENAILTTKIGYVTPKSLWRSIQADAKKITKFGLTLTPRRIILPK